LNRNNDISFKNKRIDFIIYLTKNENKYLHNHRAKIVYLRENNNFIYFRFTLKIKIDIFRIFIHK